MLLPLSRLRVRDREGVEQEEKKGKEKSDYCWYNITAPSPLPLAGKGILGGEVAAEEVISGCGKDYGEGINSGIKLGF